MLRDNNRAEKGQVDGGREKDATSVSLLDLPLEMHNKIVNELSASDAPQTAYSLSRTCHQLNSFFQVELDKRNAQQLLTYVLYGMADEAKQMFTLHPRLLFIEATADEWASGFECVSDTPVHRQVKMTPFRAMAAAGDWWMLLDVMQVLDSYVDPETQQSGFSIAVAQMKQQFPDGFDFPQQSFDYSSLLDAISNDHYLIETGNLSDDTKNALNEFRRHYIPGTVTKGYLFNLNELHVVREIYNQKHDDWGDHQHRIYWCHVAGYLDRLVPAVFAQVVSQGIPNILDGGVLERSLKLTNHLPTANGANNIPYFPLDLFPGCRMGIDCGVWGPELGGRVASSVWLDTDRDISWPVSTYINFCSSEMKVLYQEMCASLGDTPWLGL